MANKVSMEDIARMLGISKNTVSLAFRNYPGVNESTREKVLESAAKLGYIYKNDRVLTNISNSSAGVLLVIPSSARNSFSFFTHVQYGVENEASRQKFNTIITYFDDDVGIEELPMSLQNGIVAGIITVGRIKQSVYAVLKQSGLPIVMIDHYYEDMTVDCVLSDNFCGGYMAANYLQSKGHEKIGFVGDIHYSVSFYDRFQGYEKAMRRIKRTPAADYIFQKEYMSIFSEGLSKEFRELYKHSSIPSAFFCCNDNVAISVIKSLNMINIRVPEDVSVVGFDDIDLAGSFYPELTTMRVEKEQLGISALHRLEYLINNGISIPQKTVLGVELVERNSVSII